MVFDGIISYTVINEFKNILPGARIEKVVMPTSLSIDLYIYTGQKHILKIDCTPSSTKIYLSTHKKGGPLVPPSFCMVLRKHLEGSRITNISQYMLDRIIQIDFETYTELNDKQTKHLIIELMGKHSNCILVNNDNSIIDSIKHITPNISSIRSVLPGLQYIYPVTKKDFLVTSLEQFTSYMDNSISVMEYLMKTYNGFSKRFVQDVFSNLSIAENTAINSLNSADIIKIYNYLKNVFVSIDNNCISIDNDYLKLINTNTNFSINSFLDKYYTNLEEILNLKQYKESLSNQLNASIKKANKKLSTTLSNLEECSKMDRYRLYGELISANLYQLKNKAGTVVVNNFYDNNKEIEISLDSAITPQANAQKFFKKYSKLKTTYVYSIKQKELLENELHYLQSVIYSIDISNTIAQLEDIRNELIAQKYIKDTQKKKTQNTNKGNILDSIFTVVYEGYTIYVGKNNMQNEYITHKIGKTNDIWLHVQKAPGSHVVIKNMGNVIPNTVIEYAAKLASKFSKLKNDLKSNVDYTDIKYVKKHPINKPGLVIYTNFKTITVNNE